jgi:short-subunit dehydrogenase
MAKTVVITGASSGIGRALAFEFAARGYHLGLAARRLDLLAQLRSEVQAKYPDPARRIEIVALDVDQPAAVAPTLHPLFEALGGVDIVVVNAGVNRFTPVGRGELAQATQLIQTNLIGAIATAEAAVEHFLGRRAGQLVGISSLASLQAIPKQGAYCASKAGFSMYLDAARMELKRKNIAVCQILPGFVLTEIMPKMDKYPFAVSAEQAAREAVSLIEKRKAVGVVPAFPWRWLRPFFGHIPDALWRKLA